MKKYFFFILSILYAGLASAQSLNGQVNFIEKNTAGVYTISVVSAGKDIDDAGAHAERDMIDILLFQGFPGTEINTPLISDKEDQYFGHPNFFQQFYEGAVYERFIMDKAILSESKKHKGAKTATFQFKINYTAFRQYLEDNHIIRKFGL